MNPRLIRNVLFTLIGILAFIVSMTPSRNNMPGFYVDVEQFFALTMITIGGCGIYECRKKDRKQQ